MEIRTAKIGVVGVMLAFGVVGRQPLKAAAEEVLVAAPMAAEHKRTAFRKSIRMLWSEHMIWTRAYIVATIAGSIDIAEVEKRLLRNQRELGAIISPYYGPELAAKMGQLLKEDILIACEVVAATKKGDAVKLKTAETRWHENAREIAVLLSAANPNWSKEEFLSTFDGLMTLTFKEATARINKEWAGDIKAFDELFVRGMALADTIADGIIKQHPDKI